MFFKKEIVLSDEESRVFLEALRNYLSSGKTSLAASRLIAELFESEEGISAFLIKIGLLKRSNISYVVNKVIERIEEENEDIYALFVEYNILKDNEKDLMNSRIDSPIKVINKILADRNKSNRFEKSMGKLFLYPYYVMLASLALVYWLAPYIKEQVSNAQDSFNAKMSIDGIEGVENMLPIYIENQNILFLWAAITIGLYLGTVYLYKYTLTHKRELIYSFFNIKTWDDIPKMLELMYNMKNSKSSKTLVEIFENLSEKKEFKGLDTFFRKLSDAHREKESLSDMFKEHNFPREFNILIKSREDNNFWYMFENVIEYANETSQSKFDKLDFKLKVINTFLPYLPLGYFLFDLGMVFLNTMTIAGV